MAFRIARSRRRRTDVTSELPTMGRLEQGDQTGEDQWQAVDVLNVEHVLGGQLEAGSTTELNSLRRLA